MALLCSTINRSALSSYFIMTHHKIFFWWPSQYFWGLQVASVLNSSASLSSSHLHLFCCAGRGRALPSLSSSACFSCPSANSTPLTCFMWLFQCLPSLSLSAHGEHQQLSSTSCMCLPNTVLPYSLQMQSYPQSINSSPCFLCVSVEQSWLTDLLGTTQNSDSKSD